MERKNKTDCLSYQKAGVNIDKEKGSLDIFLDYITKTFSFIPSGPGHVLSSMGYFANLIEISDTLSLAVSADGVGTKVLIAQMMNKYDTVGIDCIAMNVNDIICVGAKPISFLNYIALQDPHEDLLDQLGQGFFEGAKQAGIPIPGGETAQVRDLIKGVRPGYGFDIAGMGIGIVEKNRVIEGQNLEAGDLIIGLAGSGLHSNGYSLVRRLFFEKEGLQVDSFIPELDKTLGEELLIPTTIYVPLINDLLSKNLPIKALINITGDGLLNLLRVKAEVSFLIDSLPDPPPIFQLIQSLGKISDEEMFKVFNMGIGFCILISPDDYPAVKDSCDKFQIPHFPIGNVIPSKEKKIVQIPSKNLQGIDRNFYKI